MHWLAQVGWMACSTWCSVDLGRFNITLINQLFYRLLNKMLCNRLYAKSHKPSFYPLACLHHWCGLVSMVVVLSLGIIPLFKSEKCSASDLKTMLKDKGSDPS
ncbi:Os01g0392600 [Oryza sativa Japonica Group]|uniref:Os01g0392600 protein n=1 Tax=Oryza sativa subsp. japonica TaxID=39947 RepID=A0A0P0V390_ORYSJ|nr:Os01g0392600 [Oryza sativa Japonica Group]